MSATLTVSVGTPGSLVWTKTIVYGFGQELAEDQPGMGTTFIQSDFVGSPSFTTDASGALIGRSKNLPFGERMSSWGQKTIRRYTNHEDDPDSGAIYMQAREQLPAYGKFAEVDPAYDQTKDDPESWNLYNYVTNNPVTHTDPDGRINVELGNASLPSQHHFDFDTDTFDGELNWAAFEPTAASSGGSGAKKDEAEEAQEGSSSTDTNSGDQGKDDTKDDTTSTKPDKPKEATAPKTETKSAQTSTAVKTDANGNVLFTPIASGHATFMKNADINAGAKFTVGWDIQVGYVYATDGTKIEASKNGPMQVTITKADGTKVSGGSELMPAGYNNKADCHGTTFAGGQVWINNDQVGSLLRHSGFTATSSPKLGDVGIYSSRGSIVHSVTAAGMDPRTGQPNIVYSKGGITAPALLPPGPGRGAGWPDPNATLTWYSR